jgi:cyclic beta-1,2-glucan synthetase
VDGRGLSGTAGATLDPIFSLAQDVELRPYGSTRVAYVTIASSSRREVLSLARGYRGRFAISRAVDRAQSVSRAELRQTELGTTRLRPYERLLSALIFPSQSLRSAPTTLATNTLGQAALWAHGISGDYPILLVRARGDKALSLLRELLQAHAYWTRRRIQVDLVVLNEEEGGYDQPFARRLHRLVSRTGNDSRLNERGGVFIVHAARLSEPECTLLATSARAVLAEDAGPLADQIAQLDQAPSPLPALITTRDEYEPAEPTAPVARPERLLFDNGYGGFTPSGREYVIYLEPGVWTPAPWINVVANPEFGFLVSEAGGGYTWAGNSGENRLTPWQNDPVGDEPGEAIYLRDEETGEVWSPTPLPVRESAPYLIRHGAGYTAFEHNSHGLKQRMLVFADARDPVKVVRLKLENTWRRTRRITVTYYVEWVLGVHRDGTQQYVIPEYEPDCQALLARNPYNAEFGGRAAFLAASKALHGLTVDREEFLGRHGSLRSPAALRRVGLSGAVEPGRDPCGAAQLHIDLQPGQSDEVHFVIGQGTNRDHGLELVRSYKERGQVEASWQGVQTLWDELLGTVTVQTPDEAMNLLLNRWLLYQAISCRLWARSALYQSSGAFGFRDQLQDVMAVAHTAPDVARKHILRSARHQFEEGDVLHWWHPPSGRGVRTRISDDLLWLPFVTAHYVETTGDEAVLSEEVPLRVAGPLKPREMERYGHYESTDRSYSLYDHCRLALKRGTTAGSHGLPLMGAGDWNDGMNLVGAGGQGESVWLGWFLHAALSHFAPLCERIGDGASAAAYRRQAAELQQALEESAWDGDWYRRAYYDDGTSLGSADSRECQIDSIAQSWSVLSGAADPQRAHQAMEEVARRLVREDDGLLLLFTPPFDQTPREPGYIKGYPPGIRENGGQYTHAALWAGWAFAELGQGDRAEELFRLLNPIYHGDTPDKVERYRVESYVVAADIYSQEPHVGRGGWTWYTGSAGWMHRLGIECILGLRRTGDVLRIEPCIPKAWPGYAMTYRYKGTCYRIQVENPDGVNCGVSRVLLDGVPLNDQATRLQDDGKDHCVRVLMG